MKDYFLKRKIVYQQDIQKIGKFIDNTLNNVILGSECDNRLGLYSMWHLYGQIAYENGNVQEDALCMMDKLICLGVPAETIADIYGLYYNREPIFDETPPEDGEWLHDGIDYMQLEGDGKNYPVNRIK